MKERPGVDENGPAEFVAGQPVLARIAKAAGGARVFLVGGAVRDALIGIDAIDLDLVLEGDAIEFAEGLTDDLVGHERFRTADFELDGVSIDLATARAETYPHPGSLPEIVPASIDADLDRRDFTINAIAINLCDTENLVDPRGGVEDLRRGVLRVLHGDSFRDDPTRALRAARYAARFGFDLEPGTSDLLPTADLSTISSDRVSAELRLIALEPEAIKALHLVDNWGLVEVEPGRLDLVERALELGEHGLWRSLCDRSELILEGAFGDFDPNGIGGEPASPSKGVRQVGGLTDVELLLARATGHEWLDEYLRKWRNVRLEIDGDDLVRVGVSQGPAVGVGLDAALDARLDGHADDFDAQIAAALAAARA